MFKLKGSGNKAAIVSSKPIVIKMLLLPEEDAQGHAGQRKIFPQFIF